MGKNLTNIFITKANGSRVPIANRRTATDISSAKQNWALNAEDTVSITVVSPFPQTYGIGDKITIFGRDYKLNRLPKVKKTGMHEFQYELEFEGIQYDLFRVTYDVTIDTTTNELQDVQGDTLTGDLHRFMTVLVANANRVFPGKWVLGVCPETAGDKTLTFGESDNCLSVLQNLCGESNFNVEFEIEQSNGVYTINLYEKVGQTLPYTFQYGRGRGLYELTRENVSSANIVTRLKVYGSTENITSKYRADRLCLPGKTKGQSYIEKAEMVAKYGIFEGRKNFDDIKPSFTGTVESIVSGNVLQFIDSDFPFNLNEKEADGVTTKYLIDGVAAKVHFNTGNLAGYEFEIHSYDHATHTFTLVKQTDDRGNVFPSETSLAFQIGVGDEYKILDIAYPSSIEQAAEEELEETGNKYYDQNCQPKVQYGLSVTKAWLQSLVGSDETVTNVFQPGDYLHIVDNDIDVDKSVRIQSLERNILDPYEYTLTISDTVKTTVTNRVISDLIDIDKVITINNLKDPARARANWRTSRELLNMVFDPDGDYYSDKIKPLSIDTLALSVGAKSMQFGLTNTVFQPNYGGNSNVVKWQGGVLTHYTINEETAVSWVMADGTVTLANNQAYFLYAKCAKNGDAGTFIFSTSQIKVEQDANYYHFLVGTISSIDPELKVRSLSLTYGFSMINGRFIKTGRIESADGLTYFDLDNGEIGGLIKIFNNGQYDDISYLTESLNNYTEINGGLVLSKLIAVRDNSGNIVSFVNSYNDLGGLLRKTAFAAGVSDFGTNKADAMVDIKHDGFGSRMGVFRLDNDGIAVTNNMGSRCIIITNKTLENGSNDIKNFESSGNNIALTTYISATADIAKVGDNFYAASDNVNETRIYKYSISEEILPGTYDFLLSANHLKVTLSCNVNFAQLYATQENYSNIHLQVSIIATLLLNGEVLVAETVNEYIDDTYSYTGDTPDSRILTKTVDTSTLFTKPVELIIPPRNITTVELQFEVKITGSYMCYPIDRFMFPIRAIIRDINKKEGLVYEVNPNMNLLIIGSNGIKLTQLANKTETEKIHISDSGTILPISGEAAELYIDDNGFVKKAQ